MLYCNILHEDSLGFQLDVCHAYTESFTKPWKLTFLNFPERSMLSADHMMLAAAAMLHAKFGATWPIHACVILTPKPVTNFNPSFAEDLNSWYCISLCPRPLDDGSSERQHLHGAGWQQQ